MSILRAAAQRYFGLSPAAPGEAMLWSWETAGSFPLDSAWTQLILLMFLVIVVLVSSRGLRRVPSRVQIALFTLRTLACAILAIMICRLSLTVVRTGKPILGVLVDTSLSMTLADEYPAEVRGRLGPWSGRTRSVRRIDLVSAWFEDENQEWLQRLRERYQVELFSFADDLNEDAPTTLSAATNHQTLTLPLQATGKRTNLRASLASLLSRYRGMPPAAVLVITDGVSTTGDGNSLASAAEKARSQGVPLLVIGVGSSEAVRDLSIARLAGDSVAFVGDTHAFFVDVTASEALRGKTAVLLTRAGHQEILDSAEVRFQKGVDRYHVELSHVPSFPGIIDYVVAISPIPGESNLQNNRTQTRVWVREARLKVLLLDRVPRWEFRHVKAALERDRTVELNTWLQEGDPEFTREDRTALSRLPDSLEELAEYDVVICGDLDPEELPPQFVSVLQEFVGELGGGLHFVAGTRFLPAAYLESGWDGLLPIMGDLDAPEVIEGDSRGLHPLLTGEGKSHPVLALDDPGRAGFWDNSPALFGSVDGVVVKETAQTLLDASILDQGERPLLVIQRYGLGVVTMQLFDDSWRWRRIDDGRPFRRYWSQTARFLGKRKAIADKPVPMLRTDRSNYVSGEPVHLSLSGVTSPDSATTDTARVTVIGPEGLKRTETLAQDPAGETVFSVLLEDLPAGTYTAQLQSPPIADGQPTVTWQVESVDPERVFQPMQERDLRLAAQRTGGSFLPIWEARELDEHLPAGESFLLDQRRVIPLWNRWELLLIFSVTLIGEWALRKRYRLV